MSEDYQDFLKKSGLTESNMHEITNTDYCVLESVRIEFKKSALHGIGLFTKIDLNTGDYVGPAIKEGIKTQFGRFINHSKNPNCVYKIVNNQLEVYTKSSINAGEELTLDYSQALEIQKINKEIIAEYQACYNKHLLAFQDWLKSQEQIDAPTFHDFAPGVYARTLFAKKDSIVIGKMHKTEHFNFMMAGEALIMINGELKLFKAPAIFTSRANTKKVFKVLEDMVFTTIHPTEKKDIDKLEKELTFDLEEEKQHLIGV